MSNAELNVALQAEMKDELEIVKELYKKESQLRKKYKLELETLKGSIRVRVRCRPCATFEEREKYATAVEIIDHKTVSVNTTKGHKVFNFDTIYGPKSTQEEVFDDIRGMLEMLLDGESICVFTFGDTGSGKTYTLMGDKNHHGIFPRTATSLFKMAHSKPQKTIRFGCNFYLVKNEHIQDLFWKPLQHHTDDDMSVGYQDLHGPELRVESSGNVVQVKNSVTVYPSTANDLLSEFEEAVIVHNLGDSLFTAHNHLSHLVYVVNVESTDTLTNRSVTSKITFVDVAGTGRPGTRNMTKNSRDIKKSLTGLIDVISALSAKDRTIPYRNTMLTRIMADVFSSHCKTTMFLNISPLEVDVQGTLATLQCGYKALNIRTNEKSSSSNGDAGSIDVSRRGSANTLLVGAAAGEIVPAPRSFFKRTMHKSPDNKSLAIANTNDNTGDHLDQADEIKRLQAIIKELRLGYMDMHSIAHMNVEFEGDDSDAEEEVEAQIEARVRKDQMRKLVIRDHIIEEFRRTNNGGEYSSSSGAGWKKPEYDIFLSYSKVGKQEYLASILHRQLTAMGFKVWWSAKCAKSEDSALTTMLKGLCNCRFVLCLMPYAMVLHEYLSALDEQDQNCMSQILECRLALELTHYKVIERIVPISFGKYDFKETIKNVYPPKLASAYATACGQLRISRVGESKRGRALQSVLAICAFILRRVSIQLKDPFDDFHDPAVSGPLLRPRKLQPLKSRTTGVFTREKASVPASSSAESKSSEENNNNINNDKRSKTPPSTSTSRPKTPSTEHANSAVATEDGSADDAANTTTNATTTTTAAAATTATVTGVPSPASITPEADKTEASSASAATTADIMPKSVSSSTPAEATAVENSSADEARLDATAVAAAAALEPSDLNHTDLSAEPELMFVPPILSLQQEMAQCLDAIDECKSDITQWMEDFEKKHSRPANVQDKAAIKDKYQHFKTLTSAAKDPKFDEVNNIVGTIANAMQKVMYSQGDTEANIVCPVQQALKMDSKEEALELVINAPNTMLDINKKDANGRTPLATAVLEEADDVALALIDGGADLLIPNSDGQLPFHIAVRQNMSLIAMKMLEKMKQKGGYFLECFLNFEGIKGVTPLLLAAKYNQEDIIGALIDAGADVTASTDDGDTALHFVASSGTVDSCEKLLKAGADVLAINADQQSVLQYAVMSSNFEVVAFLLDKGARIDTHDDTNRKPFDYLQVPSNLFRNTTFSRDALTNHHNALWFYIIEIDDVENIEDVIQRYVKEFGKELCTLKDLKSRVAIDVAVASSKAVMQKMLLWHGQYDVRKNSMPLNVSSECFVFRGTDMHVAADPSSATSNDGTDGSGAKVVIKLVTHEEDFKRELAVREQCNFSSKYLIPVIRSHTPLNNDVRLRERIDKLFADDEASSVFDTVEARKLIRSQMTKELAEEFWALVMPYADMNLAMGIIKENVAGRADMNDVRYTFRQIANSTSHMHSKGVIHGEIKPKNIMRQDARWKFIDLDSACKIGEGYVGIYDCSTAYAPPEVIYINEDGSKAMVRDVAHKDQLGEVGFLRASTSYDVWSLGCILYQLVHPRGCELFDGGINSMLSDVKTDKDNLFVLGEWSNKVRDSKLAKITDNKARNLLSRILVKDPAKRITIDRMLAHPFLIGKKANYTRMVGEDPAYDCFISYRVAADASRAQLLYEKLAELGMRVWFDKVCLEDGDNWKDGFCAGLMNSKVYICLISEEAVCREPDAMREKLHKIDRLDIIDRAKAALFQKTERQNFETLSATSPCDNFYLEMRMAVELMEFGLVESIFPVFIGKYGPLEATPPSSANNSAAPRIGSSSRPRSQKGMAVTSATATSADSRSVYQRLDLRKLGGIATTHVASVEDFLRDQLAKECLGSPTIIEPTVKSVVNKVLESQGHFWLGEEEAAALETAMKVVSIASKVHGDNDDEASIVSNAGLNSEKGGGGSGGRDENAEENQSTGGDDNGPASNDTHHIAHQEQLVAVEAEAAAQHAKMVNLHREILLGKEMLIQDLTKENQYLHAKVEILQAFKNEVLSSVKKSTSMNINGGARK